MLDTFVILSSVIAAYAFIVFFLLRLVVPHMGFSRQEIPETLPDGWQQKIDELNLASVSNMDYLKKSFDYITTTFHGSRAKTLFNFWKAFGNAHHKPAGFLTCNMKNYLLRVMLVKSGRFAESDIDVVIVPLNFFIHQHLDVRVLDRDIEKVIHVDPWAFSSGKKFGERAKGFI